MDRPYDQMNDERSHDQDPQLRDDFWKCIMGSWHAFDVNSLGVWADEVEYHASRVTDPATLDELHSSLFYGI